MPSEKILAAKKAKVQELVEEFKSAKSFVFASTRGLTVAQDTELRNELRASGVKLMVVKNTTLKLVFKELGIEGLDEVFEGPTTVAYGEDLVAPARIMCNNAEKLEPLEVKAGVIDGKAASKDEVIALSKVPDVTTLYSQVVYGMLFPLTKLAMLIKAVAEKDGEAAPAAEEAPAEAEAPVEA